MTGNPLRMLRQIDIVDHLIRYNPLFSRRVRKFRERFAAADSLQRPKIIDELLLRTLSWASETPYGRGRTKRLEDWPVLDKADVVAEPGRFTRANFVRVTASTGGTTGTPLKLFRSFENIAAERSFIESLLERERLDLRNSRLAILRADEIKDPSDLSPPFGVYRNFGQTLVLSNTHLNSKTLQWYVDELRRFEPQVIWVYPSMLENLLALLEDRSMDLAVPIVLSSSEMVHSSLFQRVAEQLGGRLVDYYGQGERVALASADAPEEYRFDPLYGAVELVPESDSAVGHEEIRCRVVSTGYWNAAMPLVRYDTGDFAFVDRAFVGKLDAVGRGELPFLGIKGRNSEFVLGPEGEVVSGLNHLPRDVKNLLRLQVVQTSPRHVRLNVLCNKDFSRKDEADLRANAKRIIPHEMEIEILVQKELERARNGKTPFVIRHIAEVAPREDGNNRRQQRDG